MRWLIHWYSSYWTTLLADFIEDAKGCQAMAFEMMISNKRSQVLLFRKRKIESNRKRKMEMKKGRSCINDWTETRKVTFRVFPNEDSTFG